VRILTVTQITTVEVLQIVEGSVTPNTSVHESDVYSDDRSDYKTTSFVTEIKPKQACETLSDL